MDRRLIRAVIAPQYTAGPSRCRALRYNGSRTERQGALAQTPLQPHPDARCAPSLAWNRFQETAHRAPAARRTVNAIPYLTIDPDVERSIRADRAAGRRNPHAFPDAAVERREDLSHDAATLARPAFARDIEKIVNIPAYNRYAGKTQVFSLVEDDDICRRGLHVQLVSRIARAIGALLGLNGDLIEAIALGHDLGHTPFGHAGEKYLSRCYEQRTGRFFLHNVQSVRVMDKLYRRNISLQTLDGALCHNGEFAQQVLEVGARCGFAGLDRAVEACSANAAAVKNLRPQTLEGCVVRVSDMIAYLGKDRADALDRGVIDSLDMFDSDYIGRDNAQIINNMTCDIVNNSYGRDRICMSTEAYRDLVRAKRQNYEAIYDTEGMVSTTANIVDEMFARLYERLLSDLEQGNEESALFKHHIDWLVSKSATLTRDAYLQEDPNQIVVDFISSMTDDYFMALFAHLFPAENARLSICGYCANLA